MTLPTLVKEEWRDLHDDALPPPDYRIDTDLAHGVVYVRRVSGPNFFTLVGWLAALVVAPDSRGQGIGTQIVEDRCDWLRARYISYAALHTTDELAPFFTRLGFEKAPNLPGPGISLVRRLGVAPWPFRAEIDYREPW